MLEREQSSVVEIFSSLIKREDAPVATAKRVRKAPLESTPKAVTPEDTRLGSEILASIHSNTIKNSYSHSYRSGVYSSVGSTEINKRTEAFREQVLGTEKISREDLVNMIVALSPEASYGREVRANGGTAQDNDFGGTCR